MAWALKLHRRQQGINKIFLGPTWASSTLLPFVHLTSSRIYDPLRRRTPVKAFAWSDSSQLQECSCNYPANDEIRSHQEGAPIWQLLLSFWASALSTQNTNGLPVINYDTNKSLMFNHVVDGNKCEASRSESNTYLDRKFNSE